MSKQLIDEITREEIKNGIPPEIRAYFSIGTLPLSRNKYESLIKSFYEALDIIIPKIKLRKRYGVYFTEGEDCISIGKTSLFYKRREPEFAVCIEDMIFINCDTMVKRSYIIKVAIILEELVHATMNITDEDLTHKTVCEMYDKVIYSDGRFQERNIE